MQASSPEPGGEQLPPIPAKRYFTIGEVSELCCVKLSGFGNFQLRDKPQRPGRNPKTGEEIPITARRVVTFHASQKLKAAVEQLSDASKQP